MQDLSAWSMAWDDGTVHRSEREVDRTSNSNASDHATPPIDHCVKDRSPSHLSVCFLHRTRSIVDRLSLEPSLSDDFETTSMESAKDAETYSVHRSRQFQNENAARLQAFNTRTVSESRVGQASQGSTIEPLRESRDSASRQRYSDSNVGSHVNQHQAPFSSRSTDKGKARFSEPTMKGSVNYHKPLPTLPTDSTDHSENMGSNRRLIQSLPSSFPGSRRLALQSISERLVTMESQIVDALAQRDVDAVAEPAEPARDLLAESDRPEEWTIDDFDAAEAAALAEASLLQDVVEVEETEDGIMSETHDDPIQAPFEEPPFLKKALLYTNSKLASSLPSFEASIPTWTLASRAVQASIDAYHDRPRHNRQSTVIPSNPYAGTKTFHIEEQTLDGESLIIVGIRGSEFRRLADWMVNNSSKPVSPHGFLDDVDNLCHSGFLRVAKAMIPLVSGQLGKYSNRLRRPKLLFTGHSLGGAVAALLFRHMQSRGAHSELTALKANFASIDCIVFGAPPTSVLPLRPDDREQSVFLAFANEGDPVVRFSHAYLKSIARMLLAPAPEVMSGSETKRVSRGRRVSRFVPLRRHNLSKEDSCSSEVGREVIWPVPANNFENAGQMVLLREAQPSPVIGGVTASSIMSEDLHGTIFGDWSQHSLGVYRKRVYSLASAKIFGRPV